MAFVMDDPEEVCDTCGMPREECECGDIEEVDTLPELQDEDE